MMPLRLIICDPNLHIAPLVLGHIIGADNQSQVILPQKNAKSPQDGRQ